MAQNLHITYSLKAPEQSQERVAAVIKTLGLWARVTPTFWYVKSEFSADQVRDVIVQALGIGDSVYVADATSNFAAWHNIDRLTADLIQTNWFDKAA